MEFLALFIGQYFLLIDYFFYGLDNIVHMFIAFLYLSLPWSEIRLTNLKTQVHEGWKVEISRKE